MHPSWFREWWDAYHEALFRAWVTGYRYRVRFDPANRWWNLTESTVRWREEVAT